MMMIMMMVVNMNMSLVEVVLKGPIRSCPWGGVACFRLLDTDMVQIVMARIHTERKKGLDVKHLLSSERMIM